MKIKKLLKIILVAPNYIVVNQNGSNVKIKISNTSKYIAGDMYEMEEIIERADEGDSEDAQ